MGPALFVALCANSGVLPQLAQDFSLAYAHLFGHFLPFCAQFTLFFSNQFVPPLLDFSTAFAAMQQPPRIPRRHIPGARESCGQISVGDGHSFREPLSEALIAGVLEYRHRF